MRERLKKVVSFAIIFAMVLGIVNVGAISSVDAAVDTNKDIQTFMAVLANTDITDRVAVVKMIANETVSPYTFNSNITVSIGLVNDIAAIMNTGIADPAKHVETSMIQSALNYMKAHYATHSTYIDYGLNKITEQLNTTLGQTLENSGNGIIVQIKEKFFSYNLFLNFLVDIKGKIDGQALFYVSNNVLELSDGMRALIAVSEKLGDFSVGGRYDTYKALFTQYLADVNNWSVTERTPFIADLKSVGLCINKPVSPSTEDGGTGGGTPPTTPPTAPVVQNTPDGKVTTTTAPDGTKKVTLEVDPAAVAKALKDTTQTTVSFDLTASKGATSVNVEIPAATLSDIAAGSKTVTLQSEKAAIMLPAEVLKQLAEISATGKVSINVNIAKDAPAANAVGQALDFTITAGNKPVSQFNEPVTVSMNVDMTKVSDYRKVLAYYYNEATKVWEAVGGYLNKKTGELTFEAMHFSKYVAMENKKSFSDVSTVWAKDSIEVLAARNIMNGTGGDKFTPKANITRSEVAAMLVRALNINTKPATGKFTDVASSKWYAMEVEAAANAGIVGGIGNNKFAPEANITREEIVTMIARALEYKQGKATAAAPVTFADAKEVSSFAKDAVALATSKNIIKGVDNKFMPKAKASREEVAVMIYRTLEALGEM